ncbi:hypothetical protein [uncultured Roseobacter sp.]|uniref:hypothetical protein n=1 Tax=uncultured Roseobacter sp. TaxID=114847 RepID=UPI00261DF7E6|nr:hypothetical protein [uncultured Roseobacter sp.]
MTVQLKIDVLHEPMLEFSNGELDVDPRRALPLSGPSDNRGEKVIRLGFVGLADDVRAATEWFSRLEQFMPAQEKNSQRYRDWPGLKSALNARFEIDERQKRIIDSSKYQLLVSEAHRGQKFGELVELFEDAIASLYGDEAPDCIVLCIKPELGDLRAANPGLSPEERHALEMVRAEEESDQLALFQPTPEELEAASALQTMADDLLFRTFYRALKARIMSDNQAVPVQIIRRETIDRPDEKGHSHATRAWNAAVSIYYKAKGIPWRPADLPKNVCFVGVSFHHMKKRGGHLVYASVAQAYSTDIEPFAIKGANIDHNQKRDRQPYLDEDQASGLMEQILNEYEKRAGVSPDRVVVHKTTHYQPEEETGFRKVADGRIANCDLVWLRNTSFRVVRKGTEEPWRGTLCSLDQHDYLFTSGYVPWWNEFPGMHIPAPLEIGSMGETDIRARAQEILALTKMNWNSSDGITRLPITLLFAKRVGELMCELSDNATPNPSYRFYI